MKPSDKSPASEARSSAGGSTDLSVATSERTGAPRSHGLCQRPSHAGQASDSSAMSPTLSWRSDGGRGRGRGHRGLWLTRPSSRTVSKGHPALQCATWVLLGAHASESTTEAPPPPSPGPGPRSPRGSCGAERHAPHTLHSPRPSSCAPRGGRSGALCAWPACPPPPPGPSL